MSSLKSIYRSHTCSELRKENEGEVVKLSGWISRKRDHGGVLFIDLRDNYGITQVVLSGDVAEVCEDVRVESVIEVEGKVLLRGEGLANPNLPTGEIEIQVEKLEVLSNADVLPFLVMEDDNAPEHIRLKNRFLELRREKLHNNIILRSQVIAKLRELMVGEGFTEFQTPILTSSSPEGARDFIVPSRLHPGKFYALPQAPQQFKQLLMVSGFDRYFQIAPCFRDEDSRADRSPGEFYQLDMEMSFVELDDILELNERVMVSLFKHFSDWKLDEPTFPRLKYKESLRKYGTDKPDLRNPLIIEEISESFANTEFRVFQNILKQEGGIYAIKIETNDIPSRKYFDDTIKEFTKSTGLGLGSLVFEDDGFRGSFQKLVSEDEIKSIKEKLSIDKNSVVFLAGGDPKVLLNHLGKLRDKVGSDFKLIDENRWAFCWITDFPFYEEDEETGKIDFGHNPFSMPQGGMDALLNKNPLEIDAYQYDLVINGYEVSSGAIRNHSPEIMYKAFEIAGYGKEVVEEKFGGMINAFKYGAPPHGGGAPGIDRIVMLMSGEEAIRDVIAFPLNQQAEDLLMGAPAAPFGKQLDDVHIKVELPQEEIEEKKSAA